MLCKEETASDKSRRILANPNSSERQRRQRNNNIHLVAFLSFRKKMGLLNDREDEGGSRELRRSSSLDGNTPPAFLLSPEASGIRCNNRQYIFNSSNVSSSPNETTAEMKRKLLIEFLDTALSILEENSVQTPPTGQDRRRRASVPPP